MNTECLRRSFLDNLNTEKGHILLLVLVCLILFLPGFFSLPPVDRDESRYAQASKQMIETGDYVDIRLQKKPRYKKPAGIYWLQSLAARIGGEATIDRIWAYRLPSLMGATAAVLLTYLIALRLLGASAALISALFLASTVLLGFEARNAKTDAMLFASIMLSMLPITYLYSEYKEIVKSRRWDFSKRTLWLLFWIGLSASILIKGPIGFIVIASTVAALCLMEKNVSWLRGLQPLRGILLLVLLVAPWFVAIHLRSDGAFWQQAVGWSFLGKITKGHEGHGGPVGFHTALFWLTAWPFSVFVLLALPDILKMRATPLFKLAAAWIFPTLIIYELVTTKLPHYTLPVFPAVGLLVGCNWQKVLDVFAGSRWRKGGVAAFNLIGLTLIGAAIGAFVYYEEAVPFLALFALVLCCSVIAASWVFLYKKRFYASAFSVVAMAFSVYLGFYPTAAQITYIWPSVSAAEVLNEFDGCEDPVLISSTYIEPSFVFLTDTSIERHFAKQAAERMSEASCAVAFVDRQQWDDFETSAREKGLSLRLLGRVDGLNFGGGDDVKLRIVTNDVGQQTNLKVP